MNPSGENLLVVKADNSRPQPGSTTQDVIPLSADFFVFGGIYRGVSLIVTHAVHIDLMDFGGPGLYARAVDIGASAKVQISGRLVNNAAQAQPVAVEYAIEDAAGNAVSSTQVKANATAQPTTIQASLLLARPHLWQGTLDPYLYRTVMTVRSAAGVVLDTISQPLGIRTMTFDPDHG